MRRLERRDIVVWVVGVMEVGVCCEQREFGPEVARRFGARGLSGPPQFHIKSVQRSVGPINLKLLADTEKCNHLEAWSRDRACKFYVIPKYTEELHLRRRYNARIELRYFFSFAASSYLPMTHQVIGSSALLARVAVE
jgi:hypothetical protein